MSYVELHCHSNFSFLEGASHPEDLISRAHELGYTALAITDKNGLYGVVRFSQAALEHGIKPIFGSEIVLENETEEKHLVLLVKDKTGYANLSRMISIAQLKSEKGKARISDELLKEYTDGLIALSGDILTEPLLSGDYKKARRIAAHYAEVFAGGDFYLELRHHNLPAHEHLCRKLPPLSRELGLPLVATNNVYYACEDGRRLQDVLTCIKNHTTLDEAGDCLYPNAERHLKSAAQMKQQFKKLPAAVANTVRIADKCDFSLSELKTTLPDFPVPAGETAYSYLRKLTYKGARRRYRDEDKLPDDVIRQLEHELALIHKLDFSGYFLIVWDIVKFCTDNAILVQGRGSAANSAVCYCLGITAVDPVKLKLLFERFISEERREPPDIDIDIANNRREEAIQYVYNRYGREHASMVCEVISYRGRSAVRDIGKAVGFSIGDLGRLSKMVGSYFDPSNTAEFTERIKEAQFSLEDYRVQLLADLCRQIHRFPRHLGIHVGGMIITRRPLSEIVPIENGTMENRSVIQWDKDDSETAGMVKIDLLGLGMLTMIDLAIKLVKKHRGITIDPARLSYDDPKVYDLICRAETVGVFQVESRAQMNALPRHKPRKFYDLVVEVALIRPGPIQGGMVHPYLRRRNGEEPVTYPHPCLEPILKRTLGVSLFQEQGMRVAMAAAGFTPTEADELRRAMGHKRSRERMEQLSMRLISGMMKKGIRKEAAETIFNQLAAFADFGFAESHAASFALLVYVSSYLKVYYGPEFYCSLLNAQPMGFYSPSSLVFEARRRGVKILPVNCARSEYDCTIEDGKVRLGYKYVHYIGETAEETFKRELKRGPFKSIKDFVYRTELNQLALEQMALVGAFEPFGVTRRQALWQVLSIVRQSPDELDVTHEETGERLIPDMDIVETMVSDFKGMDLSPGPHPMTLVRKSLRKQKVLSYEALKTTPNRKGIKVAGMVVIRH
jgi:error-prone DNA polymerase